jgi:uncharacterized membrane protein SpoIIM required for sporulation
VLHDHALAATRFPETGVARRLARLAVEGTHALQRDQGDRAARRFFSRRFPLAVRRLLPWFGLTLAVFLTALVFGFTLGVAQPGVGLGLLGPDAVAGLSEGRLWTESLVTTVPPSISSTGIATNNMSVALTGWAGGALFGLGSLYVVVLNGFMLGAILAATFHYSLGGRLLEFVSAHGPLEITLILATAAGGLAIGKSLVAADDRPRAEAVRDASREALVLLLGCLPWFVLLGIVEALISPAPGIPPEVKLALGLALEGLFLVLAWNPFLEEAPLA